MALATFELFRNQWTPLAHSAASVAALAALERIDPEVAALRFGDLGDVVDALSGERHWLDPRAVDQLIGSMVAHQEVDPLIPLAVVIALIPGLKVLARHLEWGAVGPWGGAEGFSADLLTTAWEVVTDWNGRRRKYMPPALMHAIEMRLARRAEAWRHETYERVEWAEIPDPEASPESTSDQLARILDDAADQLLSRRDASIVYAHRILGLTMVELASMTGLSRQSLDRRRAWAERRLCA